MELIARFLKNQRGAMVLVTIMAISAMVVVMVGLATLQVLSVAKASNRVNESFRYLGVMEEMSMVVARARQFGNAWDNGPATACPAGLTAVNVASSGTVRVCLPAASINGVCLQHTDYLGKTENFCLRSLTGTYTAGSAVPAAIGAPPGGAGTESSGSVTQDPGYHSAEPWFPTINTALWPASNNNEVYNPTCAVNGHEWLGCFRQATQGMTFLTFTLCRPNADGSAVTSCTSYITQQIAVY